MKNAAMRFCGFELRHNPQKLKVSAEASMMRLICPGAKPDSRRMGRVPVRIKGEGELFGPDCIEQYRRLYALFESGKRGLLTLPGMRPTWAYMEELSMKAEPKDDVLEYAFSFIEAKGTDDNCARDPELYTAHEGDSLWDIAYEAGTDIDELVRLNPQIRRIDDLDEGERVRLC